MKFLIGLFRLGALRRIGNGFVAPAQCSLQPDARRQRRSRIHPASDFDAPTGIEHVDRLGKNLAQKNRRQPAQFDRSRNSAGQQIIHSNCSARRAGGRHIQPARIHRNRKHVLFLSCEAGNLAVERKKSARMRLQAVAVHHRSRARHHAIEVNKQPQPAPRGRHRKVAAINK